VYDPTHSTLLKENESLYFALFYCGTSLALSNKSSLNLTVNLVNR
jgi:hypothetical protein